MNLFEQMLESENPEVRRRGEEYVREHAEALARLAPLPAASNEIRARAEAVTRELERIARLTEDERLKAMRRSRYPEVRAHAAKVTRELKRVARVATPKKGAPEKMYTGVRSVLRVLGSAPRVARPVGRRSGRTPRRARVAVRTRTAPKSSEDGPAGPRRREAPKARPDARASLGGAQ